MHLFLSPHLDDAILSCGGLIHQLVRRQEPVLIRNFMTADPPDTLPDTPLIQDLHQRWAAGDHPYQTRREEDRKAAAQLGAQVEYLNWLDCPYRTNAQGEALYRVNNDLFGSIHPADPLWALPLTLPAGVQAIYAPLGAGGHVDHQLVNQLARRLDGRTPLFFYEEYPYSSNAGEAARVTYQSGVQKVGSAAVQAALATFDHPLHAHYIYLSEADLAAKSAAIACYRSQLSTFWEDETAMSYSVRRYAQEVAVGEHPSGAERLWVR